MPIRHVLMKNAEYFDGNELDKQVNELLKVSDDFQNKLNSVVEIKDLEKLNELAIEISDLDDITEIDDYVKLHQLLRCTIRQSKKNFFFSTLDIRVIVKKLQSHQAQKLLLFMLDPDITGGIFYQNIEPQFQQAWIRELLIYHTETVTSPETRKYINKFLREGEQALITYDNIGKIYGKLYLILSQYYQKESIKKD